MSTVITSQNHFATDFVFLLNNIYNESIVTNMAKDARKQYTFYTHPVTLLCVALTTIYLLFQVYGIFSRKSYTQELLSKSYMEQNSLMTEYGKSQERVSLLETSLGKDMFKREKQNYTEEGEEVYVIVNESNSNASTTVQKKESWWREVIPFY